MRDDVEPAVSSDNQLVSVDGDAYREYLRINHEAFIKFILADEEDFDVSQPTPVFHLAGFKLMVEDASGVAGEDASRVAIAWPRGHAKTTLAKVATVYRLVYGLSRFPVYLSNTNTVAAAANRDIIDLLAKPRVQKVYGELRLTIDTRAQGKFEGGLLNPDGSQRLKFSLIALGAGQQIRGTNRQNLRPDLLVVDDLESAEEGESNKLGYEQLKKWFYGTVRKALKIRGNKIVQIGNYVTSKSILGDHIKSPFWRSMRLSAFNRDGQPLWPEMWSLAALVQDFHEYLAERQVHTWLAEMLNLPFNETAAGIKPENIVLAQPISPGDPRILLRCITVDPAITKNLKWADSCVVAVHVLVSQANGAAPVWQLGEIFARKGIGPYATYGKIVELATRWRVRAIGIEAEAYQAALLAIAEVESARAGLHVFKWIPLRTMKKSKASRIIAWSEMMNLGQYTLSTKHIAVLSQLLEYDIHSDNNDDDEIDCCAYVIHMIKNFIGDMIAINGDQLPKGELVACE